MAMKDNSKAILNYLKAHNGEDLTAADVATALGLDKRQVDGSFTAFQRKGYGSRVEAQIEVEENGKTKYKDVKFLVLNETGLALDPDADDEVKAE